jgi:hypothetical protein
MGWSYEVLSELDDEKVVHPRYWHARQAARSMVRNVRRSKRFGYVRITMVDDATGERIVVGRHKAGSEKFRDGSTYTPGRGDMRSGEPGLVRTGRTERSTTLERNRARAAREHRGG